MEPADLVFIGGDIITLDECNPTAEALAVKGEKIVAVGKLAEILDRIGRHTEVVYLNNQTLLPGFIEAHQHPVLMVFQRSSAMTNVSGYYYRTADEILRKINETVAAADPTKAWPIFLGWDPELVPDLPKLSADYLDNISTTIPIVIIAQNGHSAWVNHRALDIANITDETPDPPGGRFVRTEDGKLTGQLLEEPAMIAVLGHAPQPTDHELRVAIRQQWNAYARKGFTTIAELAYRSDRTDGLLEEEALTDDCPIRLALYMVGDSSEPSFQNTDKLWLAGVKYWADGSPHAGTMAVRSPYLNSYVTEVLSFPSPPSYGLLIWETDVLLKKVKYYHEKGMQVSIHAHGERAIEQALQMYTQLMPEGSDRRHRIEHMGLATDAQLAMCGRLGVATSMFVYHLYFYAKSFQDYILGEDRTRRWAALALAIKHGCRLSIHQDHPTIPGPPLPFANMKTAITRTQRDNESEVFGPEYCISIHEAIKAYTIGPAWQLFREKELGSLSVGKLADLVILSDNPYKVAPEKLESIRVVETYLGGHCNNLSQAQLLPFKKMHLKIEKQD